MAGKNYDSYHMMKDIEKDMFGEYPKDNRRLSKDAKHKYIMPSGYKPLVHYKKQLEKMGDDGIKKLVKDFGEFNAIKRYWIYHGEYPPFDVDNDNDDMECMVIQRILALFIIEIWIIDEKIIYGMDDDDDEYDAGKQTKEEKDLIIDGLIADMDKNDAKEMMDKLMKKMME